jgi:hypothetical protein
MACHGMHQGASPEVFEKSPVLPIPPTDNFVAPAWSEMTRSRRCRLAGFMPSTITHGTNEYVAPAVSQKQLVESTVVISHYIRRTNPCRLRTAGAALTTAQRPRR